LQRRRIAVMGVWGWITAVSIYKSIYSSPIKLKDRGERAVEDKLLKHSGEFTRKNEKFVITASAAVAYPN